MKYSEKLKDPRWQKKRLQILKRDGFKCMSCLSKIKMLSVHHKYYITGFDPWDYPNKSLITLCQDCHNVAKSIDFKTLWKRRLKLRIIRSFAKIPDFIIWAMFKLFKLKHI
jgi:5-methylcytosine-specific restriction endonuclease McrA